MKAPWTRAFPNQVLIRKREPKRTSRKSERRRREEVIYERRKAFFLGGHTHCFCCGQFVPRECRTLHHLRGRDGPLYLDERFWRMARDTHHDWIHNHRGEAIRRGLLGGLGEWGVCPPREER
jgi:hypothetical protein